LYTNNDTTAIVDQIVVIVAQFGRAALGGIGRIRIGGRDSLLLMNGLFRWVLLFQFGEILAYRALHLGRFRQPLPRYTARGAGVRLNEAAIDRQVVALHQPCLQAMGDDFFKELLE